MTAQELQYLEDINATHGSRLLAVRASELIHWLDEQEQAGLIPEPVFYEPVVRTKEDRIVIGRGSRIDSFVKLEGGMRLAIGRYVHIASFAHLGIGGGMLSLGDFSAVASGGKVISGSNQADAMTMSACAPAHTQRVQPSVTRIGNFACVLSGAVVLPGVTLGEGAVLAAGAVATKDIPDWEIWGGVPAKFIAKREVK
jgi:acetyltransferase-like isoleucine patch superfamily enzyme